MKFLARALKTIILLYICLIIAPSLQHSLAKSYSYFMEPSTLVGSLSLKGDLLEATPCVRRLNNLFKDPTIKAIVLFIESNGGAAGTIQTIIHEIEYLKSTYPKPCICFTENFCTAGAYAIACCTDTIIAPPSALIGGLSSQTSPLNISNASALTLFNQQILKGRPHISPSTVNELCHGTLFAGEHAITAGLIDTLGSFCDVINYIKKHIVITGNLKFIKHR